MRSRNLMGAASVTLECISTHISPTVVIECVLSLMLPRSRVAHASGVEHVVDRCFEIASRVWGFVSASPARTCSIDISGSVLLYLRDLDFRVSKEMVVPQNCGAWRCREASTRRVLMGKPRGTDPDQYCFEQYRVRICAGAAYV